MDRKYKCSDIVMLVSAGTVIENFILKSEVFNAERSQWDKAFIVAFEKKLNETLSKYLGINSHSQVKEATTLVNGIQSQAITDLTMFKTQAERDFKEDKQRLSLILDKLGFTKSWKKAQNNNQSSLVELLLTFSNQLTPELKQEITGKGVNAARIDAVLAHANTLHNSNIKQESLKGLAKTQTSTAINEFNSIYNQAIDICAIGQQLFKQDKPTKEQYNFSALVRAQIAAGVGSKDAEAKKLKEAKA